MSDNTPTDGKKNHEPDAAAAPDPTGREHTSTDQAGAPEHAAPASGANETVVPEPEHEPLVIDYDAINANLSAAERGDETPASAPARHLPLTSSTDADADADADASAPSLADDYAHSSAPAETVPANSSTVDPDHEVLIAPVAYAATTTAAAAPPVDDAAVNTVPSNTPQAQSPIYVQAPTKPKDRGNRGGGILIALLATVVFAVLYAVAAFIIIGVTSATIAMTVAGFTAFASLPVFYIPVIFFFLAYSGLIALINRGGWWGYVLFGFVVGAVVYFSYIGGALLGLVIDGRADGLSPAEMGRIVQSLWLNPGAIAAGLIAREVPIWAGAWIAHRGRRVTARNLEARTEYERLLAEGPQVTRP